MAAQYPNVEILARIDPKDLPGSDGVFAESLVFHYFNPHLPALAGNYNGIEGLKEFFAKLADTTKGAFEVSPVSITPVGDELVVMHTKNRLTFQGTKIETDVVLVWRIVDGRVTEVWDIPSVHSGVHPV